MRGTGFVSKTNIHPSVFVETQLRDLTAVCTLYGIRMDVVISKQAGNGLRNQ